MKGKILFTHSYFYKLDSKQWNFKQPYPPLATIQAAAFLRQHHFDVSLFDSNLADGPDQLIGPLLKTNPDYLVIYDDSFNYLSKMCLTVMREAAFEMIVAGKKSGCTVIMASSDAADHYEKYLACGADYVLKGEAEITLLELLDALFLKKETNAIPGLVWRSDGNTLSSSPRVVMKDLDTLPLPAWDLVDIESYRAIWLQHHGYFSLNVATTRGCPFKCNWCAKPIYGNRYTSRSPEHVINEIEFLLAKYKPDHLWMCDDIFGLKPGWIRQFATLVLERNLNFRFKIQSRADLLLEEKTVETLAACGAETVWIGAESGSQKILDAMDKGTTIDQISRATELMKQHNIRVAFFLQFGYLGETKEDIGKTIEMVLRLMPDEIGISISYPLPGTKFYDIVNYQLKEKRNWSDSDDLAMMFESTFHREYYKNLHRYVHSLYRRKKGLKTITKIFRRPLGTSRKDLKSILGIFYFGTQALILQRKLSKLGQRTLKAV